MYFFFKTQQRLLGVIMRGTPIILVLAALWQVPGLARGIWRLPSDSTQQPLPLRELNDTAFYRFRSALGEERTVSVQVAATAMDWGTSHGTPVESLEERAALLQQLLQLFPSGDPLLAHADQPGLTIHVVEHLSTVRFSAASGVYHSGPPPVIVVSRDASGIDAGTVAHELFHLYDDRSNSLEKDPEWEQLNPGGRDDYIGYADWKRAAPCPTPPTGFARSYGTTDPAEDRASLYEALVTQRDELLARLSGDPVLRAKVALLVRRLPPEIGWLAEVREALRSPSSFSQRPACFPDTLETARREHRDCGRSFR